MIQTLVIVGIVSQALWTIWVTAMIVWLWWERAKLTKEVDQLRLQTQMHHEEIRATKKHRTMWGD